jgi:hypothetical protein
MSLGDTLQFEPLMNRFEKNRLIEMLERKLVPLGMQCFPRRRAAATRSMSVCVYFVSGSTYSASAASVNRQYAPWTLAWKVAAIPGPMPPPVVFAERSIRGPILFSSFSRQPRMRHSASQLDTILKVHPPALSKFFARELQCVLSTEFSR